MKELRGIMTVVGSVEGAAPRITGARQSKGGPREKLNQGWQGGQRNWAKVKEGAQRIIRETVKGAKGHSIVRDNKAVN